MKHCLSVLFLVAIGSLVATGCGQHQDQTHSGDHRANVDAPKKPGGSLGVEQMGEHFGIVLTAQPAELKVGSATFTAAIRHHGEPTTSAKVTVILSMPDMDMGGPTLTLAHEEKGLYSSKADLSMGGKWRAVVKVEQEGHTGEGTFDFTVMQ